MTGIDDMCPVDWFPDLKPEIFEGKTIILCHAFISIYIKINKENMDAFT